MFSSVFVNKTTQKCDSNVGFMRGMLGLGGGMHSSECHSSL